MKTKADIKRLPVGTELKVQFFLRGELSKQELRKVKGVHSTYIEFEREDGAVSRLELISSHREWFEFNENGFSYKSGIGEMYEARYTLI